MCYYICSLEPEFLGSRQYDVANGGSATLFCDYFLVLCTYNETTMSWNRNVPRRIFRAVMNVFGLKYLLFIGSFDYFQIWENTFKTIEMRYGVNEGKVLRLGRTRKYRLIKRAASFGARSHSFAASTKWRGFIHGRLSWIRSKFWTATHLCTTQCMLPQGVLHHPVFYLNIVHGQSLTTLIWLLWIVSSEL